MYGGRYMSEYYYCWVRFVGGPVTTVPTASLFAVRRGRGRKKAPGERAMVSESEGEGER